MVHDVGNLDLKMNTENVRLAKKCELDLQIQEIMEKIEGVWRYQICEKNILY